MKKYEFTGNTKEYLNVTLHQIKALVSFRGIKAGDSGGWIEKEENLSQSGNAWVFGDAQVSGDASVSGDAWVFGDAQVSGDAQVYGNAWLYGNAQVYGNARVYGDVWVSGNARVSGDACIQGATDYMIVGPIGSRDDTTTFYRRNDGTTMVVCGCFHDTLDAFEARVNAVHGESGHGKTYRAAIAMARIRINTNPAEEETQYEEDQRKDD